MKIVFIWCLLAACGKAPKPTADGADTSTFVAFVSTFQPFRTWTSFHDLGPPDQDDASTYPAVVLGPRTQYINTLPPTGATEFPVGTVIVEARESGLMKIFASVKRGGGYDAEGALNWEWFELGEDPTGVVSITWRGTGPPVGDTYGGVQGDCSTCHTACGANNDDVCSPELQLASF